MYVPVQLISSEPSLQWIVPSHNDELGIQKAFALSGSMQCLPSSAQITENKLLSIASNTIGDTSCTGIILIGLTVIIQDCNSGNLR